jgi:site-specific DNA recombinase
MCQMRHIGLSEVCVNTNKAAIYIRSSQDQNGVAIDAQRRQLEAFAAEQELTIVAEYVDAVVSGKTENRAEFQKLCFDMLLPDREWNTLLTVDVARLSRKVAFFSAFLEATERLHIERRYADYPETGGTLPKHEELMLAIFAQHHSNACRDKGKAGMAENIEQNHRAGGRAPRGYRLLTIEQDLIRDGVPVTKTRLELVPEEANLIRSFLKGRAQGVSRKKLREELGLPWPQPSLIDFEWNALTYAGYTVWNRHYENDKGYGYHGRGRHRPRSEWQVSDEVTHPALITKDEAEAIICALERTSYSPYNHREARKSQLLTGLLTTKESRNWQCDSGTGYYRAPKVAGEKEQKLQQDKLEAIISGWISADILKEAFVPQMILTRERVHESPEILFSELRINALAMQLNINQGQYDALPAEIRGFGVMLSRCAYELPDEIEEELLQLKRKVELKKQLAQEDANNLSRFLAEWSYKLQNPEDGILAKEFLAEIIERIELDPASRECRIQYKNGMIGEHKLVGGQRSWRAGEEVECELISQ